MIKLRNDEYSAIITPTRGANCISLRNEKYNAVILREPKNEHKIDNPYLYGMPILYPVNRIENGSFSFEGKKYQFPVNEPETNCSLHGILHESKFKIVEKNESRVKCVFEGQNIGFPHNYLVEITYELSDKGLKQTVKITNNSKENMPNFLGFHTTFNIPFISNSNPEDIRIFAEIDREIERGKNYLPTGKILPYDKITEKFNCGAFKPFEKVISRHCKTRKNGKIELWDIKNKLKIIYKTDEKFRYRLFYNGNASEYFCLEPMTCTVNCQNMKNDRKKYGFDYIKPYETKKYISEIYLEETE